MISVWDALRQETRPIVMYGMGDGAQKILNACEAFGIHIDEIFASDEFVRGHSFAGYRVKKLSELQEQYEDFVIVIAFASQRPELLERFAALDAQYTVVAPDVPVAGGELFTPEFARAHEAELRAAYELMADDRSREVFEATVRFKLTGQLKWLYGYEDSKQTAFDRYLKPTECEDFVDLGAYNGDTIRELLEQTGGCYRTITAFEPDRKNCKKLCKYIESAGLERVHVVQAGVWDAPGEMTFAGKAGRNSVLTPVMNAVSHELRTVTVPVESVDHVLNGAPCSLLKIDVEGAERRALLGAAQTIRTYRPRMNIAGYHRSEDLYDLPQLIHSIAPEARISMLHHPYVPSWDTNFYVTFP